MKAEEALLVWEMKQPEARPEMLGRIPTFISSDDPRSAREQLHTAYQHGGGWGPFKGFKMLPNGDLKYPGDEPTRLLAEAMLRDETIRFYEYSWVVILQKDGSWEVSRMD